MDVNILEIDVTTLRKNISIIKTYTQTKLCLPIKANAYGHGISIIVKNTKDIVDCYAVACATEALKIRKYDKEIPILIFGVLEEKYLAEILNNNISISIHDYADIELLENFIKTYSYNNAIKAHLFVNTGMNMLGVDVDDAQNIIFKLKQSKYISLEGLYSHLACADDIDNKFNALQIKKFDDIAKFAKKIDSNINCHLANSYGCIGQTNINYDMVRPGILSYGYLPSFDVCNDLTVIKPACRLVSKVVKLIKLSDVSVIGYGLSYSGVKGEVIAIIPLGYGDGFHRGLSNNGFIKINSKMYPIVGRINMDAMAVSLKDNPKDIKVDDEVEIISNITTDKNSAKSIANCLSTIEYDVITNLTNRVIRKVVNTS